MALLQNTLEFFFLLEKLSASVHLYILKLGLVFFFLKNPRPPSENQIDVALYNYEDVVIVHVVF